jgi:hypothetical protein
VTRTTNKEVFGADGHLANLRPFKTHTLQGFFDPPTGYYMVVSYDTVIAWCGPKGENLWVTKGFFSHTTTRQQKQCQAWLGSKLREKEVTVTEVIEEWPIIHPSGEWPIIHPSGQSYRGE